MSEFARSQSGDVNSIAIIIPSYGRSVAINDVLSNIGDLAILPSELVIVDQEHPELGWTAIDSSLLSALSERGVRVQVVRIDEANLPLARNVGSLQVCSDAVLFIDDDVVLQSEIVREHLAGHQAKGVVAVGGRIEGTPVWPFHAPPDLTDLAYALGGNISVNRSALLKVGGFDTRFAPCSKGEEIDLCIRLRRAGGRILYRASASLKHLALSSGGERARLVDDDYHESRVRNMTLLALRKFGRMGSLTILKHWDWVKGPRERRRAALTGFRRALVEWRIHVDHLATAKDRVVEVSWPPDDETVVIS